MRNLLIVTSALLLSSGCAESVEDVVDEVVSMRDLQDNHSVLQGPGIVLQGPGIRRGRSASRTEVPPVLAVCTNRKLYFSDSSISAPPDHVFSCY